MITIIDYDAGNIRSVQRACAEIGIPSAVTSEPGKIRDAQTIVFPGVSAAPSAIDYMKKTGRDPEEISMLIFTHSHPDHIGGGIGITRQTGCQVAAHVDAKPWIEDVELQYKERPILNFHSLVEGPVQVNHELRDGDNLDLGDGQTLKVIH